MKVHCTCGAGTGDLLPSEHTFACALVRQGLVPEPAPTANGPVKVDAPPIVRPSDMTTRQLIVRYGDLRAAYQREEPVGVLIDDVWNEIRERTERQEQADAMLSGPFGDGPAPSGWSTAGIGYDDLVDVVLSKTVWLAVAYSEADRPNQAMYVEGALETIRRVFHHPSPEPEPFDPMAAYIAAQAAAHEGEPV